jgi:hypothetical protein
MLKNSEILPSRDISQASKGGEGVAFVAFNLNEELDALLCAKLFDCCAAALPD